MMVEECSCHNKRLVALKATSLSVLERSKDDDIARR